MKAGSSTWSGPPARQYGGPAPILLNVELSSGHGGGPTVAQAIEQNADMYAFLAERLRIPLKTAAAL